MGIIEAAHRGDGDLPTWCEGILDAAGKVFKTRELNVAIGERGERHYSLVAAAVTAPELLAYWDRVTASFVREELDPYWRFPGFVAFSGEVQPEAPVEQELTNFRNRLGASEILGLVALAGDHSMTLGVPLAGDPRLSARDRWLLTQVALHLEAGLRLRLLPGAEVARLRLDGRPIDIFEPEAQRGAWREKLGRHVASVEQERKRARRVRFEAIDTWTALASGRWVLVEREERGVGRHYAVVEAGRAHSLRALSDLEMRVAELSAQGLSGKAVSYALGVAPTTVSNHLGAAALKLGFSNRTRLVQGVAALLGVGPQAELDAKLTRSELDVLNLVRRGWSNARIASERQRSERTVANQVSALLHKLRVSSRRALASLKSP